MGINFDQMEFAENPESRCPCVLLLDISGSMQGEPIRQLNEGLKIFQQELLDDPLASLRVEVAIVTFGGSVQVEQNFVTAPNFTPPTLHATGSTPMGQALISALNLVEDRKQTYKNNGVAYYRPWVFLITDGAPTDEWQPAAHRVHEAENGKKVAFFAVGVDQADMNILSQISPSTKTPLMLKGLSFRELFRWLSSSLGSVSQSRPGEEVPLQSPIGWAAV